MQERVAGAGRAQRPHERIVDITRNSNRRQSMTRPRNRILAKYLASTLKNTVKDIGLNKPERKTLADAADTLFGLAMDVELDDGPHADSRVQALEMLAEMLDEASSQQ
jgi:hypothetical protein